MSVSVRSLYLGTLAADPPDGSVPAGSWWYNTVEGKWKFHNGVQTFILGGSGEVGGTYTKTVSIPGDQFGRPNTNPPTVVDQDNLTLYSFTVNTDQMTWKFPIPSDYDSGPFQFWVVWTNDGGTDDNGKNVKWQLSYQVGKEGDVISGSHVNSPKSVEDTYASALGWVEHHTATMSIAAIDFGGKTCIFIQIMAVTPSGTALSCEPHMLGVCFSYTAKRVPI